MIHPLTSIPTVLAALAAGIAVSQAPPPAEGPFGEAERQMFQLLSQQIARPLYNGHNLDGWHAVGGGVWSASGSEIVGERGDGRYGWLVTDQEYRDFELELDFKIEAPGNSGVQFRSHVIDGEMYGYQAEVDPRPTHGTGGVYDEKGRGWLAQPDAAGLAALKPDDWNHYRIRAVGDRIQLTLNGTTTVDFTDDRRTQGHIALQVHSGETPVRVRWANLMLTVIGRGPDGRRPTDRGFRRIFDGRTLEGWRVAGKERWAVLDRQLVAESVTGEYGYLVSQERYGNFHARLSYLVEGPPYGNSGFFFRSAIDGVDIRGLQAEVTGAPGQDAGGLYESGGRGWVAQPDDLLQQVVRQDAWNDLEVRAEGPRVRTYLNGWMVADVTDEALAGNGHLALQVHSGGGVRVRFKDLWLKPLD